MSVGQAPADGDRAIRLRLSAMMFLQYAIWGAWWVTLGTYLNAKGFDGIIGQVYATQGYAAILSPLVFGVIADRHMAAQKLVSILHCVGSVLLMFLSFIEESGTLLWLTAFAYMMCFMPTLSLTNVIAMRHLSNSAKQFPAVRVLGTIGWIAAGLVVGALAAEATSVPIQMAAALSAILALFATTLPNTAPQANERPRNIAAMLGFDVMSQVRDRSFWTFIFASLVICIPLAFYYAYTNLFLTEIGIERAAAVQTLGQVSEIAFMLALPLCLARFGIKWVLLTGMLAWAARYALFAAGAGDNPVVWAILIGIVLHGICYDFFFVAGQIHIDKSLPGEARATGQAFLSFVTLGVGTVIGNTLANAVYVSNTASNGSHDWAAIWAAPAVLAVFAATIFAFSFHQKHKAGLGNAAES